MSGYNYEGLKWLNFKNQNTVTSANVAKVEKEENNEEIMV